MSQESLEAEAKLVQALTREIAQQTAPLSARGFFYAEPNEFEVSSVLLVGEGEFRALTPSADARLYARALWRTRESAAPGKGWDAMTLVLQGDEYRIDFIETARLDRGDTTEERCRSALVRLFGPVKVKR